MSTAAAGVSPEVLARYEPVIGLEVHVQLATATKIFCGCPTGFGAPPNTNVCPVCLGLPGALPVLNRAAVELAIKAALALNCAIRPHSRFARKNYFYPDLPKGYQISQYDEPYSEHGWVDIVAGDVPRRIGITRIHMEDDAGKSIHDGFRDSGQRSYVDLNRSGTPLAELVSEPDMRSSDAAYAYLTELKQALDYEIGRQIALLESGDRVVQETRLYNPDQGVTFAMRSKEDAHDYRYFPEPDLVPLRISDAWIDRVREIG